MTTTWKAWQASNEVVVVLLIATVMKVVRVEPVMMGGTQDTMGNLGS